MGSTEPSGSSTLVALNQESASHSAGTKEAGSSHADGSLWFALFVNLLIGGLKYVAFIFSGSPSVFSEVLHSVADAGNSVALIFGNKFSQRPPDRSHPFGYGLEANVFALLACACLLGTSIWAIAQGVEHFNIPADTRENGYFLSAGILIISLILEALAVRRAAQAILEELQIIPANFLQTFTLAYRNLKFVLSPTTRFVFYEDNIAFLGALLALTAITVSHFSIELGWLPANAANKPDAIVSIMIGLLLLFMAFTLFKHNRGVLTQTSASPNVESKIIELVTNLNGVSEVLDLKTVDHGLAGLTVHLKVEVDPYTLVKDVDDLTERIKEKVQARITYATQVFVEVLADESEIEWGEKFHNLIEQGRAEGVLDAREEILLRNVYEFTTRTVRDIMIPRIDVEYVDVETPLREVADLIIESGHSRLPVFKENVDDLIGLIHSRDVFESIRKGRQDTPLADLVREIEIYPENKSIGDLLEEFKRHKIRIAAVADEHGGFAGLVTVEDVIEEIIGEIWDEHNEEEPMVTFQTSSQVLVNGKCEIEDLNDQLDLNLPSDDFKTVGGYVFGALGREPELGDEVLFEDLKFTVTEAEGPRIIAITIDSPVPFEQSEALIAQRADEKRIATKEKEV